MTMHEATRKALQEYVDGKAQHPNMNPNTKRAIEVFLYAEENKLELDALIAAKGGDPTKLAELVEAKGQLHTADGRAYVAARLRGEQRTRKPAIDNTYRRIRLWQRVTDIMYEDGTTQTDALNRCLEDKTEFGGYQGSFETIRSDFKRGRDDFRKVLETLGFKAGPALQKKQIRKGKK
jgi:macrodomain Ter protein organizer (MatP/YcbG family)